MGKSRSPEYRARREERRRQARARFAATHPTVARAEHRLTQARYKARNPTRHAALNRARRLRWYHLNKVRDKAFAAINISMRRWVLLMPIASRLRVAYGTACLSCGARERLCWDHVVPLSHGGPNTVANVQLLCASCNSAKRNRSWDYRPDDGEAAVAIERRYPSRLPQLDRKHAIL